MKILNNGKGEIFYGLHFYPGVAEYRDGDAEPYRVFINENTIRKMSPTFAGRPIYVEHVDGVDEDVDEVKESADGWVIESFFNAADGKTWAKFVLVSKRALNAVKRGWSLSNAYIPKSFGQGGLWNGVTYAKEVLEGEYEHLAIVPNPRYEESVIMTPEQFKVYNAEKETELTRLANSKNDKGAQSMKLNIFTKKKVENAIDENMIIELPKSKKEMTLTQLVTDHDAVLNMNGYANGDHMVKVGDKDEMSVNDLVKKHMEMCNEMAKMKEGDLEPEEKDVDVAGDKHNEEDDKEKKENEEDKDDKKENKEDDKDEEKKENEEDEEKKKKDAEAKKNALDAKKKENFEKVKNAPLKVVEEAVTIDLAEDQVARGKSRYGSN